MRYSSTRGGVPSLPFKSTVTTGLARDGGLFLPEQFPDVSHHLAAWAELDYIDLAFEVMRRFIDDIPERDLRAIVERSYATFEHPDVTPVRPVGRVHILELFHGPTLAFKDVALQFLGNLFEYILAETGDEINIVAATSGDTGSAAIHGVRGKKGVRIFVMHPAGRVSPVQEMQMTSVLDDNVHNIALQGTFDDAQAIVKTLFGDLPFRDRHHLGAVNSINWARVLAQTTYYFHAGLKVMKQTGASQVSFSVPTGNFGDIFAGYVAALMGLPVCKLVLATNENDILNRFFNSGVYQKGEVVPTLSPSMDIQAASNFERWLCLHLDRDADALREQMERFAETGATTVAPAPGDDAMDRWIRAGSANTEDTLATIRKYHDRHGYLLDPHTAVGVFVAEWNLAADVPMICLATAHPAKFPDAVEQAIGSADLAATPAIEALKDLPTRKTTLPNDPKAVAAFIEQVLETSPRTSGQ
ncbi:MAG: threonine synthase [Kiritimatiellia bacterium]|jgi:threonine synthase